MKGLPNWKAPKIAMPAPVMTESHNDCFIPSWGLFCIISSRDLAAVQGVNRQQVDQSPEDVDEQQVQDKRVEVIAIRFEKEWKEQRFCERHMMPRGVNDGQYERNQQEAAPGPATRIIMRLRES